MSTDWKALAHVTADGPLPSTAKLVYWYLWTLAGREPGEIMLGAAVLGAAVGRSPRTVAKSLRDLAERRLIEIRKPRHRSEFRVWVFGPAPARDKTEATPDPQRRIAFEESDHPDGPGNGVYGAEDGAEPCAVNPELDPNGVYGAVNGAEPGAVNPGNHPQEPRNGVYGAEPCAVNDGNHPEGAESGPRFCDSARAACREPAATHLLSARGRLPIPNYQEQFLPTSQLPIPNTSSSADPARAECAVKPGCTTGNSSPPSASGATGLAPAIAEAIERAGEPSAVERQILAVVPELAQAAVVGQRRLDGMHALRDAVRLVVEHGVPPRDLGTILNHVRAMRAAGTLRNPGGFFRTKIDELAGRYGIELRRPPSRASPAGGRRSEVGGRKR